MTPEMIGASWTFAGLLVVALIGMIGNWLVKRQRNRASEPEMWKRLDELAVEVYGDGKNPGLKRRVSIAEARADLAERKASAMGRIIRDVVDQWPSEAAPRLDPDDLALLDTTVLPATHWWRKKPPSTSTLNPERN
jgi:hypothetical protein